jgi:hypothetical protein
MRDGTRPAFQHPLTTRLRFPKKYLLIVFLIFILCVDLARQATQLHQTKDELEKLTETHQTLIEKIEIERACADIRWWQATPSFCEET